MDKRSTGGGLENGVNRASPGMTSVEQVLARLAEEVLTGNPLLAAEFMKRCDADL